MPALDLLRGLVMVVMALDHVRDYFHRGAFHFDPTDLTRTTAAVFLTRLVTHFCAPVFVFLAGTGAFLYGNRGRTKAELSRFLVTRGLWLVLLEFTWVRFSWSFDPDLRQGGVQVIWALGISMILLAALVHLPLWITTSFGVLMIATHNLLDPLEAARQGPPSVWWALLHEGHRFEFGNGWGLGVRYPLVPWIGLMATGYGFGALMLWPRDERRRAVLRLGLALCTVFVVVRAINLYGDPEPWSHQPSALFTALSFVNVTKYPPSLDYLLLTLGPALVLLACMDRDFSRRWQPLVTLGRVPMFFYLLHIPLIHGLAIVCNSVVHGDVVISQTSQRNPPSGDWGFDLPIVYLAWFTIVFALYWPCRWFAELKRRRHDAWLSYF